jgi:hypothetical protein
MSLRAAEAIQILCHAAPVCIVAKLVIGRPLRAGLVAPHDD